MSFPHRFVKSIAARRLETVVAALLVLSAVFVWTSTRSSWATAQSSDARPAFEDAVPAVTESAPAPAPTAIPSHTASSNALQQRPFAVARASNTSEWTAEDGRDPDVIRRLAHNSLEYQRMVDENARIFRRQLVYRNETAAAVVQRARLTGDSVRRLTLPALDGHEVEFEITQADVNPSGLQGMFGGRIAGEPDSMVTLAFKGGREAFTVISPAQGIFLQADPHEPGQVIVKSIDPANYVVGVCGTP